MHARARHRDADVGRARDASSPPTYADRVRARVGAGPAFFTFDIDFVDPPTRPRRARPRSAGRRASRRWSSSEPSRASTSAASTWSRWHPRTTAQARPLADRGQRDLRNALIDCHFQPIKGRVALYDLAVRGYMAIVGIKRVLLCALALGLVLPGVASAAIDLSVASPTKHPLRFLWVRATGSAPTTSSARRSRARRLGRRPVAGGRANIPLVSPSLTTFPAPVSDGDLLLLGR